MLTLRKVEIPEYLKHGEFYRSLLENNDDPNEEVTFPADVLKLDTSVDCVTDCDQLLNSVRFWGAEEFVSTDLIAYVLFSCPDGTSVLKVLQKYEPEFKWIHYLAQIVNAHTFDKMKVAIESGMIEFVQPLAQRRSLFPSNACDLAAEVGNLDVFICLYKHGCTWNCKTGSIAARQGHSNILQFMIDRGYKVTINDARVAIKMGRVECVTSGVFAMTLLRSRHSGLCDIATQHGHLAILQYLHGVEGHHCDEKTTAMAAHYGHLHCLQYLYEHGCPWEEQYICKYAASAGHVDCLQYLHEKGCPWDVNTTTAAAEKGHLHCLQYLHEHGCPWEEQYICNYAARGGHLDCLQYAHEHGCVFDSARVASVACYGCFGDVHEGHLACLQYAHTHGCTWVWHNHGIGAASVYYHGGEAQYRGSSMVLHTNPCWEYLYKHALNNS